MTRRDRPWSAIPLPELVRFDSSGWQFDRTTDTEAVWLLPGDGRVRVNLFQTPPDIPLAGTVDAMRRQSRIGLTACQGGLLELNVTRVAMVGAVRSIVKVPIDPDRPTYGLSYIASLTLPFERLSIVIEVRFSEIGMTGIREAVVFDQQMAAGNLKSDGQGKFIGWIPLSRLGAEPLDANLSEDASFDHLFPNHPLSQARSALQQIEMSLYLDHLLRHEHPFPLPPPDDA